MISKKNFLSQKFLNNESLASKKIKTLARFNIGNKPISFYSFQKSKINCASHFLIFLTLITCTFSLTAFGIAQTEISSFDFHPITTHPNADFAGAVSPDGKWLAFTSRRSGNLDIWIKPGIGGQAFQITTHKADDYNPTWSPDGRKLAFTSIREDAAGDIWQIKVQFFNDKPRAKGNAKKITTFLGRDDFPRYSPRGKYIAFVSERDGQSNIWVYRESRKRLKQITFQGGTHPAWSADGAWLAFTTFHNQDKRSVQKGSHIAIVPYSGDDATEQPPVPIYVTFENAWDGFPCWSPRGYEVAFTRIGLDTNFDGILTPTDPAALWKLDVTPWIDLSKAASDSAKEVLQTIIQNNPEFQIAPWGQNQSMPFWTKANQIFFTGTVNGNLDIFQISGDGPVKPAETGSAQLELAQNLFDFPIPGENLSKFGPTSFAAALTPLTRNQLFNRLLAFQRVIDFFPDETLIRAWANYEMGRTFKALSFISLSTEYFRRSMESHPTSNEASAFAAIERIETRSMELGGFFETQDTTDIQSEIRLYEMLLKDYQDIAKPAMRIEIILADLYAQSGNHLEALQRYQAIIKKYPSLKTELAEIRMKIGLIFALLGQPDGEKQAYLKIITDYQSEKKWLNLAVDEIFSFEKEISDSTELIRALKDVAMQYQHIPFIAATSQLKIGQILYHQHEYTNAVNELTIVLRDYSNLPDLVARTRLLLAEIYQQQEESLKAIQNYESIMTDFADYDGGRYAKIAEERLMDMLLESGERLWRLQEFSLALARFTKARSIQPQNVVAHRGVIKTLYTVRQIDQAIKWYETAVKQNPDDMVLQYCLGLCYSYKAERYDKKGFDISLLQKSNAIIEQTLSQNYRLLQAYQTLSVNYELLERAETAERNKPRSLLRRMFNSIKAPLVSIRNMVLRIEEEKPEHWFEKAIDVLTTAKALNDENEDQETESLLALNLANNYYKLGEYGFDQAYRYYQEKLAIDSTFQSREIAAFVYTRIGHCSLVAEDFEKGPFFLQRAIQLNVDLGNVVQVVGNMKRLALLYQLAGQYEASIEYFESAAKLQRERRDLPSKVKAAELATLYRQIAYNYNLLEDEEEILRYTAEALKYLDPDSIKKVKPRANWLKIGILGWELPVYNAGKLVTGQSTAYEGFTTGEEFALIYSLNENSALRQQNYAEAIQYNQKKLEIYDELDNPRAEAVILNQIGLLYYLQGDYFKSRDFFNQSYKLCNKEDFFNGALFNILNLTALILELNHPGRFSLAQADTPELPASMYISEGLRLVDKGLRYFRNDDVILDPRHKIMLYNLQGNLRVARAGRIEYGDGQTPLFQRPVDWLRVLDEIALADSSYRMALRAVPLEGSPLETALTHLNRAVAMNAIGEFYESVQHILKSRRLAEEFALNKLLWRIDHLLAISLAQLSPSQVRELKIPGTPESYFEEAVQIVESNVLVNPLGSIPEFQNRALRQLYEDAILYFMNVHDETRALNLLENLRTRMQLSNIAMKRPELKTEFDKNLWGNARAYQENIQTIRDRFKQAKYETYPDTVGLERQLNQKLRDYQALINEVKMKRPELQPFIRVNPPAFQTVQRALNENSIFVDYMTTPDTLIIWVLTETEVFTEKVAVTRAEIRKNTKALMQAIGPNARADSLPEIIRQLNSLILTPIASHLTGKTEIVFVPDDALYLLPFNLLLFHQNGQNPAQKSLIVPSLENYYYTYLERKLSGERALLFQQNDSLAHALQDLGYTTESVNPTAENNADFRKQLGLANIIYLKANCFWNQTDPTLSRFEYAGANYGLSGLNVLSWDLKSNIFLFENQQPISPLISDVLPLTWLHHSLFYCGTSSIVSNLWPVEEKFKNEFYQYFLENLLDERPIEAFSMAQQAMQQLYPDRNDWAAFQFYGYGGMDESQEEYYAEQSYIRRKNMGALAFSENRYSEAIGYMEDAVQMAKAREDLAGEVELYQRIVLAAFRGALYSAAIDYQLKILDIANRARQYQLVADSYFKLMLFYGEKGDVEQAQAYQSQFVEIARNQKLKPQEADSYFRMGLYYQRAQQLEAALQAFHTGLEIYSEIGDFIKAGEIYLSIGRLHVFNSRNYLAALEAQQKALSFFQNEGDDEKTLVTMQALGMTYELMANFSQAKDFQQAANELAVEIGDSLNQGVSQAHLANLSWKTGDYQNALLHLQEAGKLADHFSNILLKMTALNTKGLVLMTLGQNDNALKELLPALELAKAAKSQRDVSAIYKNIGLVLNQQQKWTEALSYFHSALAIDSTLNDPKGKADAFRQIGNAYLLQGKLAESRRYWLAGLEMARKINDGRNETQCLYGLGQVDLKLGEKDSAIVWFEKAASNAYRFNLPEIDWRANRQLGKICRQKKEMQKAFDYLQQSAAVIEEMRSRIKIEDYKAGFIDDKLDVYDDLILLLIEMGQPDKAFEMAERAKSRNFVDLLANRDIGLNQFADGRIAAQKDSLSMVIGNLQGQITTLRMRGSEMTVPDQQKLADLEEQLGAVKTEFQTASNQLQIANPELADLVSVNPKTVPELAPLLQDSTALVEYYLTSDKILIWVLTPHDLVVRQVKFSPDSLGHLVIEFRRQLIDQLSIEQISHELAKHVFAPIREDVKNARHLVIVPHGVLHYLPFAALLIDDEKYLVDDYSISLVPGATVLAYCFEKGAPFAKPAVWQPNILALGNPDLGNPAMELPFAGHEIRSVERTYPDEVQSFFETEATETNFRQREEIANMILFSCHGEYDMQNPLFSALLLAPDAQNDGRLEAHEIFGLRMNSYLVVMSACETGLGTLTGGDEVIGLSRSFIFAGTASLMASLWKVDDLATAVLIKRFFRYLKEDGNRSLALKKAQKIVREEINPHPAYWAAFNIIGDYR